MGAIISCVQSALAAIGDCVMIVVRGIASILMIIVNGVVAIFEALVACLTCGYSRRRGLVRRRHYHSHYGTTRRPVMSTY